MTKVKLQFQLLSRLSRAPDSLQTPGRGFVGGRQEFGKVAVGVRLVGQAAESGLHDAAGKMKNKTLWVSF